MPRPTRSARATAAAGLAVLFAVSLAGAPGAAAATCEAPPPMSFTTPSYVDLHRAGGEPMITATPDGALLYAAHAGTTHFFAPAGADPDTTAFVENYEGQVYVWRSTDDGKTWTFIPRDLPDNVPGSGFSDPDFAIDAAGNIYVSEINLVNVAMSRSGDDARTFKLQNFFAQTITDRQWSEADEEGVVYLVGNAFFGGTSTKPVGNIGHYLYRSEDGGKTFTPGVRDEQKGSGLGDLRVDRSDGTLYEAHYDGKTLSMAAFRKARAGKLTPDVNTIAKNVDMLSHWPAFDVDREGNLAIVWDESGRSRSGGRAAGIWYSYSKDRGETWAPPARVDTDARTDIWPWLASGDDGRIAVAWFQASKRLPSHDAEEEGEHGWDVVAAQTTSGLGCDGSPSPTFTVTTATPDAFHSGTVCQGGTACQAFAIDRRLGDYFSIAIDDDGMLVGAYSDTRRGGSVSLPAFVRQNGGMPFRGEERTTTSVRGARTERSLPATGTGVWWAVVGLLAISVASTMRRWVSRG